ncbi:ABC transporter permease [Butyrivibrio sp. MC2013]|uniref:ABC transporter permease n=1 Tax=Butyrivibrio sp. MC2013 TaxID=1280686 RepID=UPI0003FD141F|nr:ABC transporter permease [Butyrivibrio sp. MC2013]
MAALIQTAVELGLISSLTVLALYLSYTMLNVCDLSTDGAFTMGAAVGAVVVLAGHPYLSLPAAMLAGMVSGFITAILQTKMGVDSLLAGITVNTAAYSVNIAIMGRSSLLNLNSADTVFSRIGDSLDGSVLDPMSKLILITALILFVMICLVAFLRTRLGLAIRATGDNPDMVRSSSINTVAITVTGLCLSNSLTALSGCLLAQYNKSANIDIGTGMLTIALASLLIGRLFFRNKGVGHGIIGAVIGAIFFRIVYTLALRLNMPAFMLKLVSSVIVILAISGPYFIGKLKEMKEVRDNA